MTENSSLPTHNTLMRIRQVKEATGISTSQIYKLMSKGQFPAPIHPLGSRISAWIESEVNDWIAEQISKHRNN